MPYSPARMSFLERAEASRGRLVCYACYRPRPHCYCPELPCLDNATRVIVLQHPREHFHPLGTARIVARGLGNSKLVVMHSHVARELDSILPPGSALLYPEGRAQDLAGVPPYRRPKTLVVLDGTWHHTRSLYRDHRILQQLPRYQLKPDRPTEYRVRREPKTEYISTVEAVATALEILEPGASYEALRRPFRRMIDLHLLATAGSKKNRRRRRQRPATARRLPRVLVEWFDRAVVAYGEPSPVRGQEGQGARALGSWVAKRLGEGQLFAEVVTPSADIDPVRLGHAGLTREALEQGVALDQLRQRWVRFLRPDDVVIVWNQSTLKLMQQLTRPADGVNLKAAYRSFRQARAHPGSLDEVVRAEGLTCAPLPLLGRAGQRLAQAEAVARQLHRLARATPE